MPLALSPVVVRSSKGSCATSLNAQEGVCESYQGHSAPSSTYQGQRHETHSVVWVQVQAYLELTILLLQLPERWY